MNGDRHPLDMQITHPGLVYNLRQILAHDTGLPSAKESFDKESSSSIYEALLQGRTSSKFAVSPSSPTEESQPPSPEYGLPNNFGEVEPGLYRSSFPREPNFDHLAQLELKTILTLVTEKEDPAYNRFIRSQGIKHHQIAIPPNKEAFDAIPVSAMAEALRVVRDPRNYPLLIHCNKGKHRTGCVVGCHRKMDGWKIDKIIDEYRQYAEPKARELDEQYIRKFDHYGMMKQLNDIVYQAAKDSSALLTPPASDKSCHVPPAESYDAAR